jgi:predicted transcriptional regulator
MTEEIAELDQDRMIVLSLKPRFAEAILAGTKTVELRRTTPKIEVPTRALLYASTPVRALLGTCIITSVNSADLADLWRNYGPRAELSYQEFKRYFEGVKVGTALELAHHSPLSRIVPLQDLRDKPNRFRPPQSFAYIDTKTGDRILQMAA